MSITIELTPEQTTSVTAQIMAQLQGHAPKTQGQISLPIGQGGGQIPNHKSKNRDLVMSHIFKMPVPWQFSTASVHHELKMDISRGSVGQILTKLAADTKIIKVVRRGTWERIK